MVGAGYAQERSGRVFVESGFTMRSAVAGIILVAGACLPADARQQTPVVMTQTEATSAQNSTGATSASGAEVVQLTLQDAIERARKNSATFRAVQTDEAVAHQAKVQARAGLLPSVNYNAAGIYTQGDGLGGVRYIANNAVHEYISQGNVHEALDLGTVASFRSLKAAESIARARTEIASRGLVVTVVQTYFGVAASKEKLSIAQKAADEGDRFFKLTQDLEKGGEVAHADVIKAEIQMRDRHRQFRETQLAVLNARLDLEVLVFPNLQDNFEVADDLHSNMTLPQLAEVQQLGGRDNPDLRAATLSLQQAGLDLLGARAGNLPTFTMDYFYGIDASHFAVNSVSPDNRKVSNLGSGFNVSLSIPVWNWGATYSRIKQADLRREQAKREVSLAERKLEAEIQSLYAEADAALSELGDLKRSAELATESLRLTTLRYQNSEATVLEVVDAQTTFAQANSAYQDGAVRSRVALANLQTLTGVLPTP